MPRRSRRMGYISTLIRLYLKKHGPSTTQDIADGCGISLNTARVTVTRLRHARRVVVRAYLPAGDRGGARPGRWSNAAGHAAELADRAREYAPTLAAEGHAALLPESVSTAEVDSHA